MSDSLGVELFVLCFECAGNFVLRVCRVKRLEVAVDLDEAAGQRCEVAGRRLWILDGSRESHLERDEDRVAVAGLCGFDQREVAASFLCVACNVIFSRAAHMTNSVKSWSWRIALQ